MRLPLQCRSIDGVVCCVAREDAMLRCMRGSEAPLPRLSAALCKYVPQ